MREAEPRGQCVPGQSPGTRRSMTRFKSWTLTDVRADVWLDSFSVGADALRQSKSYQAFRRGL